MHVVATGEQVFANSAWLDADTAMGLHPTPGYKKRAKLVAAAVYDYGDDASASNSAPSNLTGGGPRRGAAAVTVAKPAGGQNRFYPVKQFNYSNPFKNPGSYGCGWHTGIDVSVSYQPLFAVASGTISSTGSSGSYGNSIVLRVGDLDFRYAHLANVNVTKGQKVAGGQQIGKSGNTGNSTGPHLHFEMMSAGSGYQCEAFSDPVAWLKGSDKPTGGGTDAPAGSTGGAVINNSPANIPDRPDWIANLDGLNSDSAPGGTGTCPVATPSPPIEGANGAVGPFLLSAAAADQMRANGHDPQNPCQSAVFLSENLRIDRALTDAAQANNDRYNTPEEWTEFWKQAVNTTTLVTSPEADSSDCTAYPQGLGVAEKITWAVRCQASKKANGVYLVTSVDGDEMVTGNTTDAVARLADEAVDVAASFSRMGTATCSAQATYAGVFPLTRSDMANTKLDGDEHMDRCDAEDNIAVTAKLLIDAEAVPVNKRPTAAGKFQPMIGGWAAMPWVMHGTAGAFSTAGPSDGWQPPQECVPAVTSWMAEQTGADSPLRRSDLTLAPDKLNAAVKPGPEKDPRCAAPTTALFYQGVLNTLNQNSNNEGAVTDSGYDLALANVSHWVQMRANVSEGPAVARLSVDGTVRSLPENVDTYVDEQATPNPLGFGKEGPKAIAYSVSLAGGPKDRKWLPLTVTQGASCDVGDNGMSGPLPVSQNQRTNEKLVWAFLTDLGFTPESIAGIIGNLVAESGINPRSAEGGGGPGRGIMQWGYNGGAHGSNRFNALMAWAKKNGKDQWNIGTQLEWMVKEMKDYGQYKPISTQTNVVDAMYLFGRKMEAPNEAYAHWDRRSAEAKKSLARYGATPPTGGGGTSGADAPTTCGAAVTAASTLLETYASSMEALIGKRTLTENGASWSILSHCLKNSEYVWRKIGGKTDSKFAGKYSAVIAARAIQDAGKMRPYNKREGIPRGMLIFWDEGVGSQYGHVAVSDGKGNSVNNFGSSPPYINKTRLSSQSGGLLGWAEPSVYGTAPTGAKK